MKTFLHLWQYLAEFFLEWEVFQIKVIEKIQIHLLRSITFFRKSCRLWDNVETIWWSQDMLLKIWRLNVAYWIISKHTPELVHPHPPTYTRTEYMQYWLLSTAKIVSWRRLWFHVYVYPNLNGEHPLEFIVN